MSELTRKQLFVDRRVQGVLMVRAVLYWIFCLTTMVLLLLCWRILTEPSQWFSSHFEDLWYQIGPALAVSFVMLPIVLIDVVRVSSRFAGPVHRLRRSMRELAAGQEIEPIRFREDDFWHDFAEDFNRLVEAFQENRTHQGEVGNEEEDQEQPVDSLAG